MSSHNHTTESTRTDPDAETASDATDAADSENTNNTTPTTTETVGRRTQRVNRVDPTDTVVTALSEISDRFLISDTETVENVGGNLDDTREVKSCLASAVEFFHSQLPADMQAMIRDKWGLGEDEITRRKIGFVDDSDAVIDYLRREGFSPTTIIRAGLATESTIKHLFECSGVSAENEHLVPAGRREYEVDEDCPHHVDSTIEILMRAQLQGLITPHEIDIDAVVNYLEANDDLYMRCWWDNRIVFPYRNENGEFQYLIVRATDKTDDLIYNNGIVDRTGEKCTPVIETRLGDKITRSDEDWTAAADEYIVLPHRLEPYKTPDDDEYTDLVPEIIGTIKDDVTGDVPAQELLEHGLQHIPDWEHRFESRDTTRIHVFPESMMPESYDSQYVITPAATGIEPGGNIEIVPHSELRGANAIELDVAVTPDDAWWGDAVISSPETLPCSESGFYKFSLDVNGEQHRGIVVCYDTVYTERRNYKVENWVGEEPTFEIDQAKYIKQTIDRAWINRDAVVEPIFGAETVRDGNPLIVTEGVTDAIAAHQYGLPCVAPATTNFKEHHYEKICDLAEEVSTVFIVNDNEVNNAGINGALRSAKVIENDGHTVRVVELPRPPEWDKIDLAAYLKTRYQAANSDPRSDLISVLERGIHPEDHDLYDPARHDPAYTTGVQDGDGNDGYNPSSSDGSESSFDPDGDYDTSALYELTMEDVVNFDALSSSSRSGRTIYRGEHPIQHHGDSTGYFVIRDHGEFITAKDYKIESSGDGYYYNALTWLACAATCECGAGDPCDCTRSVTRPMGPLANSEIWWAWRHAKTASHIPFPDDDRVPTRALWFLAEYHDLLPPQYIPDSFDSDKELPASTYNKVLDIIEGEYDLPHGRDHLETETESEASTKHL